MNRSQLVVDALNIALAQTGDRMLATKIVMRALVEEGLTMRDAFEAVFGPGSYQQLLDASA